MRANRCKRCGRKAVDDYCLFCKDEKEKEKKTALLWAKHSKLTTK